MPGEFAQVECIQNPTAISIPNIPITIFNFSLNDLRGSKRSTIDPTTKMCHSSKRQMYRIISAFQC